MRNLIKAVGTWLDDRVLPVYVEGGCAVHARTPDFVVKMLLLPPVRAVVTGLRRLLSRYRFYYAPEPDEG